mgnify:FL=1
MTFSGSPDPDPGDIKANEEMLQREREEKAEQDRIEEERRILEEEVPYWQRERDFEQNPPLKPLEYNTKPDHWFLKGLNTVGAAFDWVDKQAGIPGTDIDVYHARRKILDPLEETHFALGLLGEVFLPDSIDIATAGMSYIPNRFRKLGKVGIKAWAKATKRASSAQLIKTVKTKSKLRKLDELLDQGLHPNKVADMLFKGEVADWPAGTRIAYKTADDIPEDVLKKWNPPDHVAHVYDYMNTKWQMPNGQFDIYKFRELTGAGGINPLGEGRKLGELFMTPGQMGGAGETFSGFKNNPFGHKLFKDRYVKWLKKYKNLQNPDSAIQAHHIAGLYDSLPLYHGLTYDSDEWWELTARLLSNNVRPGVTFDLTKKKGNLISVIGYSNQLDTPHGVAHLYYRDKLPDIFTDEVLEEIEISQKARLRVANQFSEVVNKSEDIVRHAMDILDTLNPNVPQAPQKVLSVLSSLDDKGMLPLNKIAGKYQIPDMKDLVNSILEEAEGLPPTWLIKPNHYEFEEWLLNLLTNWNVDTSTGLLKGLKKRATKTKVKTDKLIESVKKKKIIKKKYPKK